MKRSADSCIRCLSPIAAGKEGSHDDNGDRTTSLTSPPASGLFVSVLNTVCSSPPAKKKLRRTITWDFESFNDYGEKNGSNKEPIAFAEIPPPPLHHSGISPNTSPAQAGPEIRFLQPQVILPEIPKLTMSWRRRQPPRAVGHAAGAAELILASLQDIAAACATGKSAEKEDGVVEDKNATATPRRGDAKVLTKSSALLLGGDGSSSSTTKIDNLSPDHKKCDSAMAA